MGPVQKYFDPRTGKEVKHDGDASPMSSIQRGEEPVWSKAWTRLQGIREGQDIPNPSQVTKPAAAPGNAFTKTKGANLDEIQNRADETITKNDGMEPSFGKLTNTIRRVEGPGSGIRIRPPRIPHVKVPKFDGYGGPPGGSAFPTQSFDGGECAHDGNWIKGAIKHPGALHKELGVPQGKKIPEKKLAAAASKGGKLGKRARLAETLKKLHK
jgi:hypothetical protein